MVSKMVITCTGCGKKSQGPTSLQGKKIRCKACSTVFTVPRDGGKKSGGEGKAGKPVPVLDVVPAEEEKQEEVFTIAMADDEDEEDGNPYAVTDLKLGARCPNCANEMEEGDLVCLHCGYNTETRLKFQTVKTIEHTAGDWIVWLLPGILCVFADLFLIAYFCIHHFLLPWLFLDKTEYGVWTKTLSEQGRMAAVGEDSLSWYLVFWFHPGIEIWIAVMFLFMGYLATRFAIRRLIQNPRPPEKVKN